MLKKSQKVGNYPKISVHQQKKLFIHLRHNAKSSQRFRLPLCDETLKKGKINQITTIDHFLNNNHCHMRIIVNFIIQVTVSNHLGLNLDM